MNGRMKAANLAALHDAAIARADRDLKAGKVKLALQKARELVAARANPAAEALLARAVVANGEAALTTNKKAAAVSLIEENLPLLSVARDKNSLLELLAVAGEITQALSLAAPDAPLHQQWPGIAADNAIRGRRFKSPPLPADFAAHRDAIHAAFKALEAGDDDKAREMLQPIGLASPFLEWKVLLRGLLAFYGNDTQKALENLQRLRPERLPAKLARPYLSACDRKRYPFAPPAKQGRSATIKNPVALCFELGQTLHDEFGIFHALNRVGKLVAALPPEAKHLVARIQSYCFWEVAKQGAGHLTVDFAEAFGLKPDALEVYHLLALCFRSRGQATSEAEAWWNYQDKLGKHSPYSPEQTTRMRALVWERMGGVHVGDAEFTPPPPRVADLRAHGGVNIHDPAACYEQSIALAPDREEGYRQLLEYYVAFDNDEASVATAERMLKRFPENRLALERLALLHKEAGRYGQALDCLKRLQKLEPLAPEIRLHIAYTQLKLAFRAMADKDPTGALQWLQAVTDNGNLRLRTLFEPFKGVCLAVLGREAEAEACFQASRSGSGGVFAAAATAILACGLANGPARLKKRFGAEFKAAAAAPVNPSMIYLTLLAYHYTLEPDQRKGKPPAAVATTLRLIPTLQLNLADSITCLDLCQVLDELECYKALAQLSQLGASLWPKQPEFLLYGVLAKISDGLNERVAINLFNTLVKVKKLIDELPAADKPPARRLFEKVDDEIKEIAKAKLSSMGISIVRPGGSPFDSMFDGDFDSDYDDDSDDFEDDDSDDSYF